MEEKIKDPVIGIYHYSIKKWAAHRLYKQTLGEALVDYAISEIVRSHNARQPETMYATWDIAGSGHYFVVTVYLMENGEETVLAKSGEEETVDE